MAFSTSSVICCITFGTRADSTSPAGHRHASWKRVSVFRGRAWDAPTLQRFARHETRSCPTWLVNRMRPRFRQGDSRSASDVHAGVRFVDIELAGLTRLPREGTNNGIKRMDGTTAALAYTRQTRAHGTAVWSSPRTSQQIDSNNMLDPKMATAYRRRSWIRRNESASSCMTFWAGFQL